MNCTPPINERCKNTGGNDRYVNRTRDGRNICKSISVLITHLSARCVAAGDVYILVRLCRKNTRRMRNYLRELRALSKHLRITVSGWQVSDGPPATSGQQPVDRHTRLPICDHYSWRLFTLSFTARAESVCLTQPNCNAYRPTVCPT